MLAAPNWSLALDMVTKLKVMIKVMIVMASIL